MTLTDAPLIELFFFAMFEQWSGQLLSIPVHQSYEDTGSWWKDCCLYHPSTKCKTLWNVWQGLFSSCGTVQPLLTAETSILQTPLQYRQFTLKADWILSLPVLYRHRPPASIILIIGSGFWYLYQISLTVLFTTREVNGNFFHWHIVTLLQPSANLTSILCYFALIIYDPYVNRVRTSRPPCCGLLVNVSPTLAHPNLWANVVLALCQPHTDFGQIVPILS